VIISMVLHPRSTACRLLKNTHLMCGSKGEGLLTPQQCVWQLTARPGAFDLNRKQAALQRLRYGLLPCGSVGQSERDAAVLQDPNNFVVAKKPLPLEPHTFSNLYQPANNTFCNRLLV
jgi:hypothetical protein